MYALQSVAESTRLTPSSSRNFPHSHTHPSVFQITIQKYISFPNLNFCRGYRGQEPLHPVSRGLTVYLVTVLCYDSRWSPPLLSFASFLALKYFVHGHCVHLARLSTATSVQRYSFNGMLQTITHSAANLDRACTITQDGASGAGVWEEHFGLCAGTRKTTTTLALPKDQHGRSMEETHAANGPTLCIGSRRSCDERHESSEHRDDDA